MLPEDFEKADAIFVIGQNPGANHPRTLGDLRRAAMRGMAKAVLAAQGVRSRMPKPLSPQRKGWPVSIRG